MGAIPVRKVRIPPVLGGVGGLGGGGGWWAVVGLGTGTAFEAFAGGRRRAGGGGGSLGFLARGIALSSDSLDSKASAIFRIYPMLVAIPLSKVQGPC